MPTPDADIAREAALARLDALEAELEQLAEHVRQTAARLRADVARARADVHDLHGALPSGPPIPEPHAEPTPRTEPPVGGDAPEGGDEGARLVALDLISRGVERAEAERELTGAFPGVDAGRLLDELA